MPYNPSPFERDVSPDWRRSLILFYSKNIKRLSSWKMPRLSTLNILRFQVPCRGFSCNVCMIEDDEKDDFFCFFDLFSIAYIQAVPKKRYILYMYIHKHNHYAIYTLPPFRHLLYLPLFVYLIKQKKDD
ncbi:hypothetical protein M0813_30092 [Anaeramoeba flamelloides]|uniref:Uncharacterized protein n=1 Tax=Anaeramoeba flamelloides TaxID=1746091 RepID=A0ABQ8XMK3_9EUKA|nr:hypothetical protein M0813_30092 [Anaeramoeba flamelloides]